jgi:CheY-like chemotaxis protein
VVGRDRRRILIVDDQPNWRDFLSELLDPLEYEIVTASTYDEARCALQQRAYHVIVTDVRLKDKDRHNIEGILLMDEVGKLGDATEVILVTGYPTIDVAREAFVLRQCRAYDYLLKVPESGGAFDIALYQQRAKEAAEQAVLNGQRSSLIGPGHVGDSVFSKSRVFQAYVEEQRTGEHEAGAFTKVLNRLLFGVSPLAAGLSKAWPLRSEHGIEILCWSRRVGRAVIVALCMSMVPQVDWARDWFQKPWRLVRLDEAVFAPVYGVSYTVDGMTFDEFESLVREESPYAETH